MDEIRVTYSGLISLIFGIINIPIGMVFTLILTRTVNTVEYGTWGLILGIIVYATIVEPIISNWSTREIARGESSGKTAIFSGSLFSIVGILIYSIVILFISTRTNADFDILLVGIILIPLIYMNRILTGITLGWKPHGTSYGQIIFGISQVINGIIFVYFLKMGVIGIIISVSIAYSISIIFYLLYNKKKIKTEFKTKFLKKWIKLSWIPLYPTIANMILFLDITVFSVITGSVTGAAYWTISLAITSIIMSSSLVSRAVYSKLLQNKEKNFISDSLRQLFYFLIFFTIIVITFAKPGLFLLNTQYIILEPIVIILSFQIFLFAFTRNLQNYILGIEKVDMNSKSTFREFIKSKLFFVPTISLVQSITYIVLLIIILTFIEVKEKNDVDLVYFWSIIALLVQIPITTYTIILFKKNFSIKMKMKNIIKYLGTGIFVFIITTILINSFFTYENNILKNLSQIILLMMFSAISFIGITAYIDTETKQLIKSILNEIRNKNN